MFQSARLKLTAWYLLIIMFISGFFSLGFYHLSTREIQRFINRIEFERRLPDSMAFSTLPQMRNMPSIEELQSLKNRTIIGLLMLNGVILVFAGAASYFLAGLTLRPIQIMMIEQNQFISNASHEFRTPLATLRAEMESTLLEKHISDQEARTLINSNLEEIDSLQELTNSLLQLTHPQSVLREQALVPVSLEKTAKAAVKKVTALAKRKRITLTNTVADITVFADEPQLTEVFTILLDNAIKYSPSKTTITLDAKKSLRKVTVTITDQGMGIAANDLPHIFDRFYRADKSRSQAEGYGLGLSIAKKIVYTFDGTIAVTSQKNTGTTFAISLPVGTS